MYSTTAPVAPLGTATGTSGECQRSSIYRFSSIHHCERPHATQGEWVKRARDFGSVTDELRTKLRTTKLIYDYH